MVERWDSKLQPLKPGILPFSSNLIQGSVILAVFCKMGTGVWHITQDSNMEGKIYRHYNNYRMFIFSV